MLYFIMKTRILSLVAISSAFLLQANAEKVKMEQVPAHVRDQIRAQAGSARIEDIDKETRNGKTVYEVAFKEDGQHREFRVEDNGAPYSAPAAAALDSRKIGYDALPQAVKRTVHSRIRGAEINDIDRQVKDGKTTYEVGYKSPEGDQRELLIADNGAVLRDRSPRQAIPSVRNPARPNTPAPAAVAARRIKYDDLPANVRRVADANLKDGSVSDVERRFVGSAINYEIGFLKENGQRQQLVISEYGQMLRNEIMPAAAIGSPAANQSGSGSGVSNESPYRDVTTPIQLRNAQEIERTQLPVIVDRTLQQYVRHDVKEVLRGQWRGNPVYQVGFADENNNYVELQIDDSGRVIYDPRTRSATPPPAQPQNNLLNDLSRALLNRN